MLSTSRRIISIQTDSAVDRGAATSRAPDVKWIDRKLFASNANGEVQRKRARCTGATLA